MKHRFKNRFMYSYLMIQLILCSVVFGQDKADEKDREKVEQARQTETFSGEIDVRATFPGPAMSSDLARTDLQDSGAEDLGGFLRGVAGMESARRGTINLDPQIRGLQEGQVGVFVDGTRTFAAGPARMDSDMSHVGPHAIENVRIVKGPYALSWGAGAMSAIRLETVRPAFRPAGSEIDFGGELGLSYSENDEALHGRIDLRGAGERFRYYLGVGSRRGEDYEDGAGRIVPADYTSDEGRWRFGWLWNASTSLDYTGGYQQQKDLDYPGRLLDATYFYTRSHSLEWQHFGEGRLAEVYGQIYVNRKDHRMNNDEKPTGRDAPGRTPPFALDIDLPTESNTSGARLRFDLRSSDVSNLRLGVDYTRSEQTASRTVRRRSNGFLIFSDIVWPDAEITDLGAYAQLTRQMDAVRWGFALRVDEVDASAGELSPFYAANTSGSPDRSETNVSAAVSALIDLGDQWDLEIGAGRVVRSANALERYSDRFPATKFQIAAEFMGRPEIDPEEGLEINAGLRGRVGGISVDLAGFYRRIDDYVTVAPDPTLPKRLPLSPPVVFRYVNGDRATFYGGELSLRHQPADRFFWHATASWVRAQDEELDEPVLGIAPLRGEVGASFELIPRRWRLDLSARFADRQDRVAASRFEQETPGYAIYDIWSTVDWSSWTLRFGVENLSDKAYSEHLNAPNPFTRLRIAEIGRSFRIGLERRF